MSVSQPPWVGQVPVGEYPYEETHDLRTGPDLHPALLGLLPLVGIWRGRGRGGYATIEDFDYGQEVRFSHDGRPVLHYESRSWLLDAAGSPVRPLAREVGWWRPVMSQSDPSRATDELEVMLAHPTGITELYLGRAHTTTRFELATDAVVRAATAKPVAAGHRLYGVVDGALLYAYDLATADQPLQSHLSARLERVAG